VGQGHIHDFNAGIPASGPSKGLFWTAAVPMNDVEIDLGRVRASFHVTDFPLVDTIPSPNPAATVSFDMEWSGKTADLTVKDFVNAFAGEYHECSATIEWTAQEAGFTFVSDAASTSTTRFAEIGRERNGKFFSGEE
jgi:hypothetical protein